MKNILRLSLLSTLLLIILVPAVSAESTRENSLLNNPDKLTEIATAFGISTDTLTTELQEGNSLKEIAKEYNVPKEDAAPYIKKHPKRLTEDQLQEVADKLGISVDEVKSELKSHTLHDTFSAQNVEMKSFMDSIGVLPPKHMKDQK